MPNLWLRSRPQGDEAAAGRDPMTAGWPGLALGGPTGLLLGELGWDQAWPYEHSIVVELLTQTRSPPLSGWHLHLSPGAAAPSQRM